MNAIATLILIVLSASVYEELLGQSNEFSDSPNEVNFYTDDIANFWKVFDESYPKFEATAFQAKYLDVGSKGLKGFLANRIESGEHIAQIVNDNLHYYMAIRESSLAIGKKRKRFYECFSNLKKIYPQAVFPDVYFVVGAKNSGGTAFSGGLIIGAEMFGEQSKDFKPIIDINYVDEVVAHELIHFQQQYAESNSLLAQCIKEGAADFICELIAGGHSNGEIHNYGDAHSKELWNEFLARINDSDWTNWLYQSTDKSRPKDLGYWIGYKITKSYYMKTKNKMDAVKDILNIQDFNQFLIDSEYKGG